LKWLRIIKEPVLQGEQGGGGSGRYADFGVDVLYVVADCLLGDAQCFGDVSVRHATCEQRQHLHLTNGEAGNRHGSSSGLRPRSMQNRFDGVAGQPPCANIRPQYSGSMLGRQDRPYARTWLIAWYASAAASSLALGPIAPPERPRW
jgi:hypothetical protein